MQADRIQSAFRELCSACKVSLECFALLRLKANSWQWRLIFFSFVYLKMFVSMYMFYLIFIVLYLLKLYAADLLLFIKISLNTFNIAPTICWYWIFFFCWDASTSYEFAFWFVVNIYTNIHMYVFECLLYTVLLIYLKIIFSLTKK